MALLFAVTGGVLLLAGGLFLVATASVAVRRCRPASRGPIRRRNSLDPPTPIGAALVLTNF